MKTIKIYYHTNRDRSPGRWFVLEAADAAAEELEGRYETVDDVYNASEFYPIVGNVVDDLLRLKTGAAERISAFIDRIEIVQEGTA